MKHILITTIAAVVLVGCGPSEADRALLKAAERGNIKAVKQHLDAGADVNAKDEDGFTPLHYAAVTGRKEIAEILIAEGADVNAKIGSAGALYFKGQTPLDFKKGQTPLDWAIGRKRTETAALLRKHGGKTGEELKAEGK